MSADVDTVLTLSEVKSDTPKGREVRAALDRLAAADADVQDAVSEIGEYSEGLAPADLLGAVTWLIQEETRTRIALAAAEALQQAEERASRRAHSMWRTESERADAAEAQRNTLAAAAEAALRDDRNWQTLTAETRGLLVAALAAVAPTEAPE